MLRTYFSLILFTLFIYPNFGASQLLEETAKPSPEKSLSANVEWDDVGFLGRIGMTIYDPEGNPKFKTMLPQIKPSPANLTWINEDWVVCESILGEKGSAFYYTHIPSKKAYLIEIFAPEKSQSWMINFSSTHHETTRTLPVLTNGRNALFPILLRELPEDGIDYFTPEFALLLEDAVNSFNDWAKKNKLIKFDFLPVQDYHQDIGSIMLTLWDDKPAVTYFPGGTTTTREMLAESQIHFLPKEISGAIKTWELNNVSLKWKGTTGEFVLAADEKFSSNSVAAKPFYQGSFDGVSDTTYLGPSVEQLIAAAYQSEKTHDEKLNAKSPLKLTPQKKSPPAPRKATSKKKPPTKVQGSKSKTPSRSRR